MYLNNHAKYHHPLSDRYHGTHRMDSALNLVEFRVLGCVRCTKSELCAAASDLLGWFLPSWLGRRAAWPCRNKMSPSWRQLNRSWHEFQGWKRSWSISERITLFSGQIYSHVWIGPQNIPLLSNGHTECVCAVQQYEILFWCLLITCTGTAERTAACWKRRWKGWGRNWRGWKK